MIKNYDQIIEWLNKIRAIYGAPPITEISKGQACNGNHCPLCNSLVSELHGVYQVDMSYDHYTLYTSFPLDYKGDLGQVQSLPLEDGKFMYTFWGTVPDFIRDFLIEIDDNQYPELAEPLDDNSFDEGEEPADTINYEQTFVSKREWFFEEEDEEWEDEDGRWIPIEFYRDEDEKWEPDDIYDFYDADDKGMLD